MPTCGNDTCNKDVTQLRKGLCQACYRRQMRNGTTDYVERPKPLTSGLVIEKSILEENTGCLTWQGATDKDGYPRYYCPERYNNGEEPLVYVRRYLLNPERGEIVEDTCENNMCVNIEHLRIATVATGRKTVAGINSVKTHCINNHELTNDNVVMRGGKRRCKTCEPQYSKKSYYKTTYGITFEEFLFMIAEQDNKCKLCKKEMSPPGKGSLCAVPDHNHTTGKMRGALHSKCNIGLGHFDDDISIVELAAEYLKKYE